MKAQLLKNVKLTIDNFINWIEDYGETSYDHQSFFAGTIGRKAKALYYKKLILGKMAVAPMIFCEAFFPSARKIFFKKQRFPIADAHYAMGFALLYQIFKKRKYYEKALHFLDILEKTRCPNYQYYCWGYPFNWVTRNGTIPEGTPLITITPYVYEAFLYAYQIDKNDKWLKILHSIAEHVTNDIKDFEISSNSSSCSYTPYDQGGVINASAYRAFLLTNAYTIFSENRYWQVAERNLNFVLQAQQQNGSWYYAVDGIRDFVDHFHTCFVLKALTKINQLIEHDSCRKAISKGIKYYINNLLDEKGLPKPFSKAPRLTVYRQELYDFAECINLAVLLKDHFAELDQILDNILQQLMSKWIKQDGSFCSRKLLLGWDKVPMHRWAQSQLFRSLCFLLYEEQRINNTRENNF